MIPLAVAVAAAYGVHLLWSSLALGWEGLGPGPRGERPQTWAAVRDRLGLGPVRPAELAASAALLALVGSIVGYALLGGPLAAAALAGCAATTPFASARARQATRHSEAHEAWPRLLEEVRVRTSSMGRSVPQALIDVGANAPGSMRPAFEAGRREWLMSADFARTTRLLKEELADPTADAALETLLVAHELGSTDLDRRLQALIDDRIQDVQGRKDARAKQAGVRFARRFVLVVPAGMALVGLTIGDGRDAYGTTTGQLAVLAGVALVVVCWLWAGAMLRLPGEQRVFDA